MSRAPPGTPVIRLNGDLFEACLQGNVANVGRLLADGADPNEGNQHGSTPLNRAAAYGHLGVVDLLLAAGADPNAADKYRWTPLHSALHNYRVVRALIKAGSDVNALDCHGRSPLLKAVRGAPSPVFKLLLKRGADPNVRDRLRDQQTLLFRDEVFAFQNRQKIVYLLAAGADIHALDCQGHSALVHAHKQDWRGICRILVANGADPDVRDHRGNTLRPTLEWLIPDVMADPASKAHDAYRPIGPEYDSIRRHRAFYLAAQLAALGHLAGRGGLDGRPQCIRLLERLPRRMVNSVALRGARLRLQSLEAQTVSAAMVSLLKQGP